MLRILVPILVLLCACQMQRGAMIEKEVVTTPDGMKTTTKVSLPPGNKEPSGVVIDADTSADIGPSYKPQKRDYVAETQTELSTWFAAGFAVLAVAFFIGHRYFPLVPTQAPMLFALLAGGFYLAPTLVDRYSGQIAAGVAGWVAWTVYSYRQNRKLEQKEPKRDKTRPGKEVS